jgi:hypothetical protein
MPALAGRQLIEFAGGVSSKALTISSNAIPVYIPAGGAFAGAQITLSSMQIVDNTPASLSKAVSLSTGTIKASAGSLFMVLPTTSGDINIMDGTTSVARIAVVAATPREFGPWGIPFTTSISISASAAVATYVYK